MYTYELLHNHFHIHVYPWIFVLACDFVTWNFSRLRSLVDVFLANSTFGIFSSFFFCSGLFLTSLPVSFWYLIQVRGQSSITQNQPTRLLFWCHCSLSFNLTLVRFVGLISCFRWNVFWKFNQCILVILYRDPHLSPMKWLRGCNSLPLGVTFSPICSLPPPQLGPFWLLSCWSVHNKNDLGNSLLNVTTTNDLKTSSFKGLLRGLVYVSLDVQSIETGFLVIAKAEFLL